jgi:hypothetical protein
MLNILLLLLRRRVSIVSQGRKRAAPSDAGGTKPAKVSKASATAEGGGDIGTAVKSGEVMSISLMCYLGDNALIGERMVGPTIKRCMQSSRTSSERDEGSFDRAVDGVVRVRDTFRNIFKMQSTYTTVNTSVHFPSLVFVVRLLFIFRH